MYIVSGQKPANLLPLPWLPRTVYRCRWQIKRWRLSFSHHIWWHHVPEPQQIILIIIFNQEVIFSGVLQNKNIPKSHIQVLRCNIQCITNSPVVMQMRIPRSLQSSLHCTTVHFLVCSYLLAAHHSSTKGRNRRERIIFHWAGGTETCTTCSVCWGGTHRWGRCWLNEKSMVGTMTCAKCLPSPPLPSTPSPTSLSLRKDIYWCDLSWTTLLLKGISQELLI